MSPLTCTPTTPLLRPPQNWQVLIIPISHEVRSLAASPSSLLKEVAAYKDALRKLYESSGRAAVFFERAIAITQAQTHAFVEALPVPKTKADELGELFIEMGRKINIDFEVSADFDGVVDETGRGSTHYYSVELPDGTCLVHKFPGMYAWCYVYARVRVCVYNKKCVCVCVLAPRGSVLHTGSGCWSKQACSLCELLPWCSAHTRLCSLKPSTPRLFASGGPC